MSYQGYQSANDEESQATYSRLSQMVSQNVQKIGHNGNINNWFNTMTLIIVDYKMSYSQPNAANGQQIGNKSGFKRTKKSIVSHFQTAVC